MNETETIPESALQVLDGVTLHGGVNTPDAQILDHIRFAIRQGHPQIKRQGLQMDRICLVGSGPSLADTERELVDLLHAGAKLVTVNGAYRWCLERNLKPQTQIVLDARPENVRFLDPEVPGCHYVLASQCHPDVWRAVAGREKVWIFHGLNPENPERGILDEYYLGHWHGVAGGTTVTTRAIALLRMLGYLRFDLFGIDSCWMGAHHHAFAQPENDADRRLTVTASPSGHPELARTFTVAPWHLKQLEDFLQFIRINGQHVLLHVHGDGLIAYALRASAQSAELTFTQE